MKKIGLLFVILLTLTACSFDKMRESEKKEIDINNIGRKVNVTIDGITYKNIKLYKKSLIVEDDKTFLLNEKIPDMTLVPISISHYGKNTTIKYTLKIGSRLLITSSIQIDELEEKEPLDKNNEENKD